MLSAEEKIFLGIRPDPRIASYKAMTTEWKVRIS
jgi:hypothetical protein